MWWRSPKRLILGTRYDPDPAGSSQAMAAFVEGGRRGGQIIPMRRAYPGVLMGRTLPITGFGGARVSAPVPRAFPATTSPTGEAVTPGSAADLLYRTSTVGR